ncbi:hypothetical protein BH18ACI2_BH18ACI2_03060 [soil metagenome]
MNIAELMETESVNLAETDFRKALNPAHDERKLITALERLGRLPAGFDGHLFLPLLGHDSPAVRLLAVKNLGKLKDETFLDRVRCFALVESNTLVRREAVSTLGRMRTQRAVPALINFLHDQDAKIVLQAIRALLPFKQLPKVQDAFEQLKCHPNELIQDALPKTFEQQRSRKAKDAIHPQSPDFLKNLLVHGDVREVLKYVPDESIHLTFTSPPYYNARDYTIYQSYEEYLQFLISIFKEVHRVTKEGRFFVLNTSPVIVPRMSRSHASKRYLIPFDIHPLLTQIGWEFIEDIVWVKPDPSAKNRNGGFFQHRKPLGYKANSISEYVIVYRKKTDKLIDWNMQQYPEEIVDASKVFDDYEKTNIWKIAPSNDKVHPATFPKELAARVIKFYSFVGDLVFDPFAGTGTVGRAALSLERFYFMAEREGDYFGHASNLLRNQHLFSEYVPRFHSLEQFAQASTEETR